uniref:Aerobactin siderophore biosynthesis IucA/IucC N-terminal domain-containing protein n=1 Tax=Rhodopseudomonas palustris (strain BisA53) TaxID=316055 RepID=Q07U51_RHOP5
MKVSIPWNSQSVSDYLHLERYVNDGSPTGFTEVHKTSPSTNPFTASDHFPILEFSDNDCDVRLLGKDCEYLRGAVNFAHPDSVQSPTLSGAARKVVVSPVVVSPVAGGRTMLVREGEGGPGYLKLTYDFSRIGRVDRQLSLRHCMSSIEVSNVLETALDRGYLGNNCALLREPSARVTILGTGESYEWGTIFRERAPYPYVSEARAIVPGFSLFGRDRKDANHKALILQFIDLGGYEPVQYLMDLLLMIIDSYWKIVTSCGLHIECHGQNCMFEVTPELRIVRFIVKDMDSVDKDIPLSRYLGVERDWASRPYMCMDEGVYYYPIRASFMYDFKLGMYMLDPLIQVVCSAFRLNQQEIESNVRDHVRAHYIGKLPPSYFPGDGCWYDCDNTERKPGTRREYFPHPNPRFR